MHTADKDGGDVGLQDGDGHPVIIVCTTGRISVDNPRGFATTAV